MQRLQKIMIVEDEAADAALLRRALTQVRPGVAVDVASDGDEALDVLLPENPEGALRAGYPRCVLLDLKLRRMDGVAVLRALKNDARARNIPVIVFTSSSDPTDVKTAYDLGANSYVVKPVHSSDLSEIAEMICAYWLETNHAVNSDAR